MLRETETIPVRELTDEELQFQQVMQYFNSVLAKHIRRDLNSDRQARSTFNKSFKKDDVVKWLANPQKHEKQLRDLSRFLINSSLHYKRLVQYFAAMLTFDYVVDIYNHTKFDINKQDKESIKKRYIDVVNKLEIMNLKHEFSKLMSRAWTEDVVYGYEYSTKNSFFIETLDPDYCAISSIEDGVYNYAFNFQYFDKRPDGLERLGEEFKEKYELYQTDKKKYKWQELDSNKTICIKITDFDYAIPPLAGIFEEIYALYDYKDLQLSKTELDNYLLLVAQIPYINNASQENAWALSLDIAKEYFNLMNQVLPEQIGAILSPYGKVESIKLDRPDKELDAVSSAENAIYNAAGVPKLIFNSDKASGAALNKAIRGDEAWLFNVLRQFERWVNRKLKDGNKKVNFKVTFLNITHFNQGEVAEMYKTAATLGVPCKQRYCAALGLTPSDVANSLMLENDILEITDKFIPLSTSYTQSSDNKGGRPENKNDDIEELTEVGRDLDTNNPENRA